MITANEASEITMSCKDVFLRDIEEKIRTCAGRGERSCIVKKPLLEFKDSIQKELIKNGFKILYFSTFSWEICW